MGLKRTPLFAAHQKLGGRLIEFGGWEMPVQYSSIMDEHLAVRKNAGLFDISHMGELLFTGPGALDFLNHTLTNDLRKLAVGQGQYTLMCNEHGGVIDDLYAYRIGADEFLLIVNASRVEPDAAWLQKQQAAQSEPVRFENASDRFGAVALQGPRAVEFIDACIPGASVGGTQVARASQLVKNQLGCFNFQGKQIYVARTGYTGEDGFEVVAPAEMIEAVWDKILAAGHAHCLQPAGLGARDTLRTEVCYPLYGHELDEQTTPMEAGLGSFVALEKGAGARNTRPRSTFPRKWKPGWRRQSEEVPVCGPGGDHRGRRSCGRLLGKRTQRQQRHTAAVVIVRTRRLQGVRHA